MRLRDRIRDATRLDDASRAWLLDHPGRLEADYARLPSGRPWCPVHGDAWVGNALVTDKDPVVLDLERFSYGPPEWDLIPVQPRRPRVWHPQAMTASPGDAGQGDPLDRLARLRQHERGGRRSPHKPLLVLLALGRLHQGHTNGLTWQEAQHRREVFKGTRLPT